jgi:hypothetical protein
MALFPTVALQLRFNAIASDASRSRIEKQIVPKAAMISNRSNTGSGNI